MELATGPLPSRAPIAASTEHRADPWGDFLRRVLVLAGPAEDARAGAEAPGSPFRRSAARFEGRADVLGK